MVNAVSVDILLVIQGGLLIFFSLLLTVVNTSKVKLFARNTMLVLSFLCIVGGGILLLKPRELQGEQSSKTVVLESVAFSDNIGGNRFTVKYVETTSNGKIHQTSKLFCLDTMESYIKLKSMEGQCVTITTINYTSRSFFEDVSEGKYVYIDGVDGDNPPFYTIGRTKSKGWGWCD